MGVATYRHPFAALFQSLVAPAELFAAGFLSINYACMLVLRMSQEFTCVD
jgi:hypothetical protein